jgi:SRSO17 transposase
VSLPGSAAATVDVGVQRQFTGTAGRIENAQVGVSFTYASERGHAFIDRRLYLPRSWTEDPDRCARAGVPADTEFATKPALAGQMITAALDAGTPAGWVAGDEVYGNDPALRALLRERGAGHVLGVACDHRVRTGAGIVRAAELAAGLPAGSWEIRSAGDGAKGKRWYGWALFHIDEPDQPGRHDLLIRRSLATGGLAFFRCWSPTPVALAALIRVAGLRWRIEEDIQAAETLAGLDQHQIRRWTSWHR